MKKSKIEEEVTIELDDVSLAGLLWLPDETKSVVLFSHGSGSSRLSPRNHFVARLLHRSDIGTLLFDLLTEKEDIEYRTRFNIPLLTERLVRTTRWLIKKRKGKELSIGYFGASTGAAAALEAAVRLPAEIHAVVSRGGRPDLAIESLPFVKAPSLLIVGGLDSEVIELNQLAYDRLVCRKELVIVPGATHLFEESGTLEQVANLADRWFIRHLALNS